MVSLHPPRKETMTPYILIRELEDSGTGRYGQCGPTHVIEEVSAAAPGGSKATQFCFLSSQLTAKEPCKSHGSCSLLGRARGGRDTWDKKGTA